ncbi:MAG: efflux RND transporter periplasmic adaptor subunit [Bacteroidales bacterium]|nr:efflux RND transporter periplasmic adaptor subunit [Bacteroidales bacterium]
MRTGLIAIISIALFAGCSGNGDQADAYGTFEATEVIVSAETSGRILKFDVAKGSEIAKGEQIVLVDTTLFHLQKDEIDAGIKSISTRIGSVNAQNEILNQQIANLNINIERTENMLKNEAATQKQYDDLLGQRAVLQKQIVANSTQRASIEAEISVYKTKRATMDEQINRCSVKSPLKGTLIEKYAEEGELTGAGRPLAKIADLSVIKLKVYVSGAQLGSIKLGGQCTVRVDDGDTGYKTFQGMISHIAEKAEFTPKIIQTKEERVTLVYAVTIDVANDGTMKSGMPGEAIF